MVRSKNTMTNITKHDIATMWLINHFPMEALCMTKKHLKKLISFSLSAVMIMGMSIPVFARETDNTGAKPAVEDTSIYTGQTFLHRNSLNHKYRDIQAEIKQH